MPKLSSDTKAVLRELRRHDHAIEEQIRRLADLMAVVGFEAADAITDSKYELVVRRREKTGLPPPTDEA